MSDDNDGWIEVKQRCKKEQGEFTSSAGEPRSQTSSGLRITAGRSRISSFNQYAELSSRPRPIRPGREAHRVGKLEWGATKLRERQDRVEKREAQRRHSIEEQQGQRKEVATPESE